jgi:hypothetical protein
MSLFLGLPLFLANRGEPSDADGGAGKGELGAPKPCMSGERGLSALPSDAAA